MIAMCKNCRKCLHLDNRHIESSRKKADATSRGNIRAGMCWKCRTEAAAERPTHRMPAEPTKYAPGTIGKIIIMAMREANGECIFHPDDVTFTPTREELVRRARTLPFRTPFVGSEIF